MNSKKFSAHLSERPGDFRTTEAIRPASAGGVRPREGFRVGTFHDDNSGLQTPVLAAAVSRERLFDVFLELLDPLGEVVDVVLETSHDCPNGQHIDLRREHIDLPVLVSHCCDFEDLLLNDGCTGMAVIGTNGPMEVQFDEHKLLVIFAHDLEPFEAVLRRNGVPRNDRLPLILEGEHVHHTQPHHRDAFDQLGYRLGVSETAETLSW